MGAELDVLLCAEFWLMGMLNIMGELVLVPSANWTCRFAKTEGGVRGGSG